MGLFGSKNGNGKSFLLMVEKAEAGFFTGPSGPQSPEFRLNNGQMSVGRRSANDIVLRSTIVSGHHGTLIKGDGTCLYKDHSKNGTWLLRTGSTELHVKNSTVELQNGDVLEFGRSQERIFRLYFEVK